MPQLADITVKKNDGTTDVTYTGVIPSAGDKSAAVWRNNAVATAAAHRPELQMTSQWNGPRTARRVASKYTYPALAVGSDGKINVADKAILEVNVLLPQSMPDSDINEFVSQGLNLAASTLYKNCAKVGYAAT